MCNFGREVTGNPGISTNREWLVTNGIGGFASGTVAGLLTRRYHGLLVAALQPPLARTVLLAKVDDTAIYDGQSYELFTNQWNASVSPIQPQGFLFLERFHLEGTTPVWTYAIEDSLLEKRIWMQHQANTTYIRYNLRRATQPLTLKLKMLINYRDYHSLTNAGNWQMHVESISNGVKVLAYDRATPFYLFSELADIAPEHDWYRNYFHQKEQDRGLDAVGDNLYGAHFHITLQPGETVTLVASTETNANLDGQAAYVERRSYEQQCILQSKMSDAPDWIQHLALAADQFIVRRTVDGDSEGRSIIAGYHWFGDWGRDTMISLPGLTLTTGRYDEAASILRTFAHHVDQGMLPNRFPDQGEVPEYNTVDATLWYFEAIRAFYAATGDNALVQALYPVLQDIIDWHQRGTRYQIHIDPSDGLLYAGESGVQLTWMDAKVGDWVVTPRIGKPIEVNALWYNALRIMVYFAELLGEAKGLYEDMADSVQNNFGRFWYAEGAYCFDVIDGPDGADSALRPNQLLAVSLPHSPLSPSQQQAVVDLCARRLLTSIGLRSLSPNHPHYVGHFGGGPHERDAAYHQGAVWAWLIGPFIAAHLRVYKDRELARSFLEPFAHHLADYGVGSITEIAEGNPPHHPRAAIAQAWSVAEVLRVWEMVG